MFAPAVHPPAIAAVMVTSDPLSATDELAAARVIDGFPSSSAIVNCLL